MAALLKVPGTHCTGDRVLLAQAWPSGQGRQSSVCPSGDQVPLGQLEQSAAFSLLNVPLGHRCGNAAGLEQWLPAGHSRQLDDCATLA